MRVAVVGGGIAGLAAARRLARSGARVTLHEAGRQLGGLGESFLFDGRQVEKFYHCILPSDTHLRGVLDELGLADDVHWRATSMGVFVGDRLYRLDTPLDLLRFDALRRSDRLRVGLFALRARLARSAPLDDVTAREWLEGGCGARAFDLLWRPLLEAKFGERFGDVPALWMWRTLTREKAVEGERKGYLNGGLKRLTDTLAASLSHLGTTLRTSCPVEAIEMRPDGVDVTAAGRTDRYDAVLSTVALPLLRRTLRNRRLAERVGRWEVPYQGVICGVFLLSRPLTPHYWIPTVHAGTRFQGIVEMTNLAPRDWIGGHLVYVMNYTPATSPLYGQPDSALAAGYLQDLQALFPDLRRRQVLEARVFRAPYVEPVAPLGYLRRKAPVEVVPGRLVLATTAQVYPEVTSWNSSVGLAHRAADALLSRAPARSVRPRPLRRDVGSAEPRTARVA